MIAIITVGDCELIVLRRVKGPQGPLELVCHTEMQRIDGHAQTPLQLARVDDRIDPNFNEELSIEVIERGSAVNCVSAYEGDIVLMGLRPFAYDLCFSHRDHPPNGGGLQHVMACTMIFPLNGSM